MREGTISLGLYDNIYVVHYNNSFFSVRGSKGLKRQSVILA